MAALIEIGACEIVFGINVRCTVPSFSYRVASRSLTVAYLSSSCFFLSLSFALSNLHLFYCKTFFLNGSFLFTGCLIFFDLGQHRSVTGYCLSSVSHVLDTARLSNDWQERLRQLSWEYLRARQAARLVQGVLYLKPVVVEGVTTEKVQIADF